MNVTESLANTRHSTATRIACPFVYANGRRCPGHVTKVAAFHAHLEWEPRPDGSWAFTWTPGSRYRVFCSLRDDHSSPFGPRDERMLFERKELPKELQELLQNTR